MRILFLNQYFPPDPAPTGVLFGEIADALRARGHEVRFIDAGQEYRGGQGKGGRMRRELLALIRMLWRGLWEPKPDVVVSGTSPPCLAFVAQVIALRHGARSIHWCMDLYPEIAVALGEINDGSISRLIAAVMGWSYRRTSALVALDSDMAARLRKHGVEATTIRPWVTGEGKMAVSSCDDSNPSGMERWTWLYSGNLGRAHEWQTLLDAQAILEAGDSGIELVFQGGGPSWAAAQAASNELGLKRVEWRSYVTEEKVRASLLQSNCLVVTQKPEVCGMLWPSKLALMLTLARPILFVGPPEGDIAQSLRALSHAGVFTIGNARGVADWLLKCKRDGSIADFAQVVDAVEHRAVSISRWVELIESRYDKRSERKMVRPGSISD